ncbi:hypothetical protein AMATHDRAFT_136655 [Amanita thiersii Skay4041]|uniref:Replication factor A protein 3 n=1 Tax=Amanita thiersii Skay4041 TaxID=703135 RepID=A0A2A9NRY8_9AGAR|nr:hypothetical protein AMATHDRAFT_136655 [Amanita thiersii Skay4041]
MSREHIAPRVNAALFPRYVGQVVRLTCKRLAVHGDTATVQASDGGELHVQMTNDMHMGDMGPFLELVGNVQDVTTMKLMTCVNLGDNLDLEMVDRTIQLIHSPKFSAGFWGEQ